MCIVSYPLSFCCSEHITTLDAVYARKDNRLSPPIQLQCLHSGAGEPGNKVTIVYWWMACIPKPVSHIRTWYHTKLTGQPCSLHLPHWGWLQVSALGEPSPPGRCPPLPLSCSAQWWLLWHRTSQSDSLCHCSGLKNEWLYNLALIHRHKQFTRIKVLTTTVLAFGSVVDYDIMSEGCGDIDVCVCCGLE